MKRTMLKAALVAGASVMLMAGTSFATQYDYFYYTDLTTNTSGNMDLIASNLGDYSFGIYWVDDSGAVSDTLEVTFSGIFGELDWAQDGALYDVADYFSYDGSTYTVAQDEENHFGFYFSDGTTTIYTDEDLNTTGATLELQITPTAYTFSYGDATATVFVDDISPTPEPASMLLFGAGLVGLAGVRRRKMKK